MDIESRLHGRLFSKRKCDASVAGAFAGGKNLMRPACLSSDLEHVHRGLQNLSPRKVPYSFGSCFRRRIILLVGLIQLLPIIVNPSSAALINVENCLSPEIINNNATLQFIPFFANAVFNATTSSYNLNVTVYGNIAGGLNNNQNFSESNQTDGKIPDIGPAGILTTLKPTLKVLDYTLYNELLSFCNSTVNGHCPLAPVVFNSSYLPEDHRDKPPAFSVAHDLYSSYSFTTITAILKVKSGDSVASPLACIEASITPDLGRTIRRILVYVPLVILMLVAVGTACAAIFSPWGSADIFRWTSNYGRHADLLRLVTPGFGDCLQYIQFIFFAGSLSLNYPGFYQPVVSHVGWSVLMFNESFVSRGNGTLRVVDGIYAANGSYGLDKMSQLIGMTSDEDSWAGMVIWLLIILAAFVVLIQVGFLARWGYRHISNTREEDLRAKNLPLTIGNSIRIVFNYFFLPIISLSTYQMVIAGHSPAVCVGLAAILLVACVAFAVRLLWLVASTRPRSKLFDDLPTVLLYGPLYNTYSDNAATFALVPVMLTFVRGIAIGAIQPSGIAQLVLLAICEVILILTLNAFRPFHSPTSMNAFHTFFATVRLLTILLSVAFVPSLGVKATPRGWIGYVILLMHGIVLVVGFFLNATRTLIEVIARLAGAGGEEGAERGAARGLATVFGGRQLSRRNPRRRGHARHSMGSDAHILAQDSDRKSFQLNGSRSRSMSGSSAILLNRQDRSSTGLESITGVATRHNNVESGSAPYTPTTSGGASAFSYLPAGSQPAGHRGSGGAGANNLRHADVADPYYRPPRVRRRTNDALPPRARSRGSWASAERANRRWSQHSPEQEASPTGPDYQAADHLPDSRRATPLPAHFSASRDRSDSNIDESRRTKTDYAIREVDFYYGVRGPALSTQPSRRLKTGPADPTGPVSSATGWFKGLLGGKTKDKGKGFEVVRSAKAPPMDLRARSGRISGDEQVPYSDDRIPERVPERKRDLELSDDGDAIGAGTRHLPDETAPSSVTSEDEAGDRPYSGEDFNHNHRVSEISQYPPSLPNIDIGNGIELPSRIVSKASSRPTRDNTRKNTAPVEMTRGSSQHGPLDEDFDAEDRPRLGKVPSLRSSSPLSSTQKIHPWLLEGSLHPSETISNRLPFDSRTSSSRGDGPLTSVNSTTSSILPNNHNDNKSALGSLAPDLRHDRPASLGYVQQHRASENIHTASPDKPSILGSTAEVVDTSINRYFP